MSEANLLTQVATPVEKALRINHVYGEPVCVGDRIVIPVARVAMGLGGGSDRTDRGANVAQVGGGGGGGGRATPVGALEITPTGTRFIRFGSPLRTALTFGAGLLFGLWMSQRCRRN